jgi:hypothetical protein
VTGKLELQLPPWLDTGCVLVVLPRVLEGSSHEPPRPASTHRAVPIQTVREGVGRR